MYAEVVFPCPNCASRMSIGPDKVGTVISCPGCHRKLKIGWAPVKPKKTPAGRIAYEAFKAIAGMIREKDRAAAYQRLLRVTEWTLCGYASEVRRTLIFKAPSVN